MYLVFKNILKNFIGRLKSLSTLTQSLVANRRLESKWDREREG